MYTEEDLLPLSALQHLLFCERQCALIHVEQLWAENRLTVEGRHLHAKAHEAKHERRGRLWIVRGVPLRGEMGRNARRKPESGASVPRRKATCQETETPPFGGVGPGMLSPAGLINYIVLTGTFVNTLPRKKKYSLGGSPQ